MSDSSEIREIVKAYSKNLSLESSASADVLLREMTNFLEDRCNAVQVLNLARLFRSIKLMRIDGVNWTKLGEFCTKRLEEAEKKALALVVRYSYALEDISKQGSVVRSLGLYGPLPPVNDAADFSIAAQHARFQREDLGMKEEQIQAVIAKALQGVQD